MKKLRALPLSGANPLPGHTQVLELTYDLDKLNIVVGPSDAPQLRFLVTFSPP